MKKFTGIRGLSINGEGLGMDDYRNPVVHAVAAVPVNQLDTRLEVNPHYSDPRFDGISNGHIVYGCEEKGLTYDYMDRIWGWDWEKAKSSSEAATRTCGVTSTARWFNIFLSTYFEKPIEVRCIRSGVRRDNGYAWVAVGYRDLIGE